MTWPWFPLKCALNVERCRYSVTLAREDCEHAIAFAVLQNERALMSFNFSRHDLVMPLQRSARFRRIGLPCPARPLHIGKQKSYGTDRSLLHRTDYEVTRSLGQRRTR